jgi:N-dimethylarginine dimethylaminohydrolase
MIINSYTHWDPLEEVWLGDVYPASWYDHLEPAVRDVFQQITENTKQDLNIIQRTLESLGVIVRRPTYKSIDDWTNPDLQHLNKPVITPRDYFITLGNKLYVQSMKESLAFADVIDHYKIKEPNNVNPVLTYGSHGHFHASGSDIVRVGRDIYIDIRHNRESGAHLTLANFFTSVWSKMEQYRITILDNGGHLDGCFAPIRPGLLLTTDHFTDYDKTFPGWDQIKVWLFQTKNRPQNHPLHNGKWHLPDGIIQSKEFNQHIIDHAMTWVGDYTETYFDVNTLVVDENNILMLDGNEPLADLLAQKYNINVHWVPFRTRTFWDGGCHCLTLDIRRRGGMQDYFPDRNDYSMIYHKSQ